MAAFNQMAFHHHAHNIALAVLQLLGHIGGHFHLAAVVFAAVGMAEIHHQARGYFSAGQLFGGGLHVFAAVVGLFAAAQNHMAIGVAGGVHDGGMAGFGYR